MTSAMFDTDVYARSSQARVLGEVSQPVEAPRPSHAKTEVWMNHRSVCSTVAVAAAALVCVTITVYESRVAVDRDAFRAESSVDDNTPAWMASVTERLNTLLSLPKNWDSYGAPPITREAVDRVVAVLESLASSITPTPSVGPTPEGGVQVEWHERGVDLELRSDSDGRLYAFFQNADPDLTWDDELLDESVAAPWFEHLAGDA